jgi:predicted RNA-binding protein with TRAM domain
MIDFSELALETFQVLRAYGKEIVLYDENGNRVFEPSDARRFYLEDDNILVSVLEDGDNSAIKVYLSDHITIAEVMEFATVLRHIATQFNVLFNLRKYNKQLVPKDFATQAAVQEQKEYSSMNIMEGLYGTSKSSYLKLENARMIVRHSARVNENMIGGRGRSIQSIFIENAQGERFLFPVNVLSGARAMTQHVNHGGTFADEVGQQIIRMAQDFSNLSNVANHIYAHQKSLPAEAMNVRESVRESAKALRHTFERLCRDDASYVRESARITEGEALTESALSESVEALRSFLAIEGIELADTVLESVCKHVDVAEDMRPATNPQDDSADKQQDALAKQPQQPQKPVSPSGAQDDGDDKEDEGQDGAFHEDEDMDDMDDLEEDEMANADPDEEGLAENNEVIEAFNAWMAEFDVDTMFEGKSFKRNDDDSQSKKEKDEERRKAREEKRRTDEGVYGAKWFKNKSQWLNALHSIDVDDDNGSAASYGGKLVAKWYDDRNEGWISDAHMHAMSEGKTFKRNRDEDADDKKKQDQQRREERKKEPVEEGKSFKRNKDEDVDQKKKDDKERRDSRKQEPVEEGKSFKRNDDEEGDVKQKRNEDQKRREERKNEPVEEGKSFKRNKDEDADEKKKQDKERREQRRNEPVEEGKSFKRNDDEDSQSKKEKDEERRKAREEKQRTDEASDISFQDAKRELPGVKAKLKNMNAFHPEYKETKMRHDKLQDRLSRMQDDEVDEAVGGPGYVDHNGANMHDSSACNETDEETDESYVSGDGGHTDDSLDVIEGLSLEDFIMPRDQSHSLADEVESKDKDGHTADQSMIDRMRTLAGLNKI